jgi:hypothetical protein
VVRQGPGREAVVVQFPCEQWAFSFSDRHLVALRWIACSQRQSEVMSLGYLRTCRATPFVAAPKARQNFTSGNLMYWGNDGSG